MVDYRPSTRSPSLRPTGVRRAVGISGELFVTAAVILGLFLVYTLWWTNVEASQSAKATARAIRIEWSRSTTEQMRTSTASTPGMGFLHVPALHAEEIAIVAGTDPERLNEGVAGYYTEPSQAAMPWDAEGNFALAAHRDGHGARFHDLDKVKVGDSIVVETKDAWYVYTVFATLPKTTDTNIGVIQPVPQGSGRHTRGRYITLTTCTPVFTSDYRLVVWGELTRIDGVDAERGLPPELRR
ncbi:class E sortase [Streptomyces erythrochromogenes]|uniref:class E sortase n=1 Tax=Streptomyces erythrochromogenes TaxID=285574 RepID=UPI0036D02F36